MTDCNQKQIRDAIYGIISGRYVGRPRNKYTCIANRERGKRKRKTEGDRKREKEGESTDELAWKRWTALAATSEVGPKCKAANLIRRLAEGSVASGPVASRGTMWHADSRQLYIINSHKYANPPVERSWRCGDCGRRAASVSHADLQLRFLSFRHVKAPSRDHETARTIRPRFDITNTV